MTRLSLPSMLVALALAAPGTAVESKAAEPPATTPATAGLRVIEITARRFQFSPSVVTLRKDEPVLLRLRSEDVTHGFFQKPLGIDTVIEPGRVTEVALSPRDAGRYIVICHHFCGSGHGGMKLTLVVE